MTYESEHRRMRPVLDLVRNLDVATNPDPEAMFEAGAAGFQIWCTPEDHPEGWPAVPMTEGTFAKPCAYVASVVWGWSGDPDEPRINRLLLTTDAYALMDLFGGEYTEWHNRPEDVAWARQKIAWVFEEAGVELPPIEVRR